MSNRAACAQIATALLCLTLAGASGARAECVAFMGACHEFKLAAAVFDGTIEQSDVTARDPESTARDGSVIPPRTVRRARVRVNRSWKGVAAGQVIDVYGLTEFYDDFVDLSVGLRYLFYARQDEQKRLWAQACGRTLPIAKAAGNIAHFESEATLAGGAAFGDVRVRAANDSETPAPGIVVVLNGPLGERRTRTDAKGSYLFRDLPVGQYRLTIELEKTLAVLFPTGGGRTFAIQDKRECDYATFILRLSSDRRPRP